MSLYACHKDLALWTVIVQNLLDGVQIHNNSSNLFFRFKFTKIVFLAFSVKIFLRNFLDSYFIKSYEKINLKYSCEYVSRLLTIPRPDVD